MPKLPDLPMGTWALVGFAGLVLLVVLFLLLPTQEVKREELRVSVPPPPTPQPPVQNEPAPVPVETPEPPEPEYPSLANIVHMAHLLGLDYQTGNVVFVPFPNGENYSLVRDERWTDPYKHSDGWLLKYFTWPGRQAQLRITAVAASDDLAMICRRRYGLAA